ncbi:MAG: methyltransferase domain-containing protein [Alphaproteobacteria bacterium]|nr:methyltransferase domain-containing protein [Alphaproteobacteria bacterium]
MKPPENYYSEVNPELFRLVPPARRSVLEIGCGAGAFGAALKHQRPGIHVTGVELHGPAAEAARAVLDRLIHGSIETPEVQTQLADGSFDTLVAGDVLEHLLDPWGTLAALDRCLAPGAQCLICIPNVQHWSMVDRTMTGLWIYQPNGLMDRTHLRWFSRTTTILMLRELGWQVAEVLGRLIDVPATKAAVARLLPAAVAAGADPRNIEGDLSAFQWVFRAVKP